MANTSAMMKNLVMGFATNTKEHSLRVFTKSLRRVYSQEECDLVIITNRFEPYFKSLSESGVIFIPTTNNYSSSTGKISKSINRIVLNSMRGLRKLKTLETFAPEIADTYDSLIENWHHPHFVRWFAYERFLRLNQAYGQVFLSDVKDVVFQAPFFSSTPSEKVSFFDMNLKYGECFWDTKWYRDAFGERALRKVIGKSPVCIGTILGPHRGMLSLTHELRIYFSQNPFGRIEQAVFNYLILNNLLKTPYEIVAYDVGPVATLTDELHTQSVIENALIRYAKNGLAMPIVHLYDRHRNTKMNYDAFGE